MAIENGMMTIFDDLFDEHNPCLEKWKPNVPIAVFVILFDVIGLFGNAIVIFVIIVLKEYKKSVSDWYILQLALADTLFLTMLPLKASSELSGKWDFGEPLCKATEGIIFMNYYASIFFLTIISFERYLGVTEFGDSPWADFLRSIDLAALISLITWLISIGLCVPISLYSKLGSCSICAIEFPRSDAEKCEMINFSSSNQTACEEYLQQYDIGDWSGINFINNFTEEYLTDFEKDLQQIEINSSSFICKDFTSHAYNTWLYVNFSVMVVFVFVLICVFYGLILCTVVGTAPIASTNQRRYRMRVILMIVALVSLFSISWIPWYTLQIAKIKGFYLSEDGCERLTDFTWILSYMSSALNPYFYSLLSSRFPSRLKSAFLKTRRLKQQLLFNLVRHQRANRRSGLHGVSVPPVIPPSEV